MKVFLVSAHGKRELKSFPSLTLLEILHLNQIPWCSVSTYLFGPGRTDGELFPKLHMNLDALPGGVDEVRFYYQRNVDASVSQQTDFRQVSTEGITTSQCFYQGTSSKAVAQPVLKDLSSDDCQTIVAARVHEFLRNYVAAGSKIVIGVSGGGDSNALLHGLSTFQDFPVALHPVIIKGLPEWDAGVHRAQELCNNYGLDLTIVEERDVRGALGMGGSKHLLERFQKWFQKDDFEILASLLIRLSLKKQADLIGTNQVVIGANCDDLLSEYFHGVCTSLKFHGIPVRLIGELKILYPLWMVPKIIIDGCFPKYSLENYETRYPSFAPGRNLYYHMSYTFMSTFPGMGERILQNISRLPGEFLATYPFDADLGFHVLEHVPLPVKHTFMKMLSDE